MKKKHIGVEELKSRSGFMFTLPWLFGMIVFFMAPIIMSICFSFAELSTGTGSVEINLVGLKNYDYLINMDPKYIKNLLAAGKNLLVNVPFILILSIILGIILNNEFKGRIFFRSLFFLPVILSSGVVLELFLAAASSDATEVAVAESVSFGMIDFTQVIEGLNLPQQIQNYLTIALDNLFMLIWQSGIQIILIIAGLQTIPDLLYEVAEVEGATKWEQLWYVTLPMLVRTMLLVLIFTMVEVVTIKTNPIISQGYSFFANVEYGTGSAALWLYFSGVLILFALVLLLFDKVFLKKWG